jgi:predicted permease
MLFLPLAVWMGFRGSELIAILIMLGSPTTVSCYIMARNMGHEGVLTSNSVILATVFSSFSLTLWIWLLRSMGYL